MLQRTDSPTSLHGDVDTDVIVLGAGISGLACAAALRKAGLHVIVLEARERIGGRLHTVALGGGSGWPNYAVDLGGAWVHGIGGNGSVNELYRMACELKLTCRPTDYNDAAVYTADGVRLPESAVADIENLYHVFEQHLHSLLHAPDPRLALLPIQTALDAFTSSRGLSAAQREQLTFAVSNHMEHYWAGEMRCMGVAALDEEVLPGGDVVLAEGYGGIVEQLAAGLDVRLRHEVLAVQYGVSSSGGVCVTARVAPPTFPPTAAPLVPPPPPPPPQVVTLAARAAVVTLPVGVLRSGAVAFHPPLEVADPAKAAAIQGLGVALYNKVIMLFAPSDVFWDDTAFIYRMSGPGDGGRWTFFLNLHKVTGAPILIAFNLGEAAAALEAASDEETVGGALAALAGMYGSGRVRPPIRAAVTRWGSDPYSRMSYSYIPAGLTAAAFDDLARPVARSLYFAGEATHRRCYGTAHGAFDSGQLAAAAILHELRLREVEAASVNVAAIEPNAHVNGKANDLGERERARTTRRRPDAPPALQLPPAGKHWRWQWQWAPLTAAQGRPRARLALSPSPSLLPSSFSLSSRAAAHTASAAAAGVGAGGSGGGPSPTAAVAVWRSRALAQHLPGGSAYRGGDGPHRATGLEVVAAAASTARVEPEGDGAEPPPRLRAASVRLQVLQPQSRAQANAQAQPNNSAQALALAQAPVVDGVVIARGLTGGFQEEGEELPEGGCGRGASKIGVEAGSGEGGSGASGPGAGPGGAGGGGGGGSGGGGLDLPVAAVGAPPVSKL